MPSNEISRIQGPAAARPVGAEPQAGPEVPKRTVQGATPDMSAVKVETASGADIRQIPIDAERVAQIRYALQEGTYPLIPSRTADAMIAARMLLSIAP